MSVKEERSFSKYLSVRLGSMVSAKTIFRFNALLNYMEVARWLKEKGMDTSRRYRTRDELFSALGKEVADKDVLYMEFGVMFGAATRFWASLLKNPKSKLHGFDSFQGLPEKWEAGGEYEKGAYTTKGQIPKIDDPRVKFFVGWFNETLPDYEMPDHEVLIINLDPDLYSSTAYVLNTLKEHIVPGSYIYFDEFHHRNDELRAFNELLDETGWKFSFFGATKYLNRVIFKRES